MIEGNCHCGDISFSVAKDPESLTDCNCSICRRLGSLWVHAPINSITITNKGETIAYIQGDRSLAIHTCKNCGCTTHWENLSPAEDAVMAVNFRMCSDEDRSRFPVRHFDGADTWSFLD